MFMIIYQTSNFCRLVYIKNIILHVADVFFVKF